MSWYITIQQEMSETLGLAGNELIVFAFINGYSQEGQGCYYGSLSHLQRVCGIASRQTAISVLSKLVEKKLITKSETTYKGIKHVAYSVCPEIGQGVQNLDRGCPEIGHNNKEDNKVNTDMCNKSKAFKKPTLEQVEEYCRERGNTINPQVFIDHYESNGWMVGKNKMKDWKACVRTWEQRDGGNTRQATRSARRQAPQQESQYARNLKAIDQMFGTNHYQRAYGKKEDHDEQ